MRIPLLAILSWLAAVFGGPTTVAQQRPNILWITAEDHGPDLGCYGCEVARTPRLDALAERGVRYTRAWSNAPVCSVARTTLITGCYPTSLGGGHHRTSVPAPDRVEPFPALLRRAGYYTSNRSKTDYNLRFREKPWDMSNGRAHWRRRAEGQPFFSVFNFTVTHESQTRKRPHTAKLDPSDVPLPPHHPDLPEVRQDWAQYHDKLAELDRSVGGVLDALEEDGLAEDTIVFFFSDHGAGFPGHKRTPREAGLRVPLLIYVPERYRDLAAFDVPASGAITDRLVSFVDLGPTVLSLCGLEPPAWMHGKAFLGPSAVAPAERIHGYRGRMDERFDLVRCVRDERYLYVRNLLPRIPLGQHYDYEFQTPLTRAWFGAFQRGELTPVQARHWLPRPAEELYDLARDPEETVNLAGDPDHQAALAQLRAAWRTHALTTVDIELLPESELARRAGARSPGDLRDGEDAVDVAALLVAVEAATGAQRLPAERLAAGLEHPDAGVRWWFVQGLLQLGEKACRTHAAALGARLSDPSPAVRIAAAEALATHSGGPFLSRAHRCLLRHAAPAAVGWWASVESWNAIDRLPDERLPERAALEAVGWKLDKPPGRGPKLIQHLRTHVLDRHR